MKSKPLRIGITCYPTFGGSGVIATEIGMAMAERGHKVHFICYDVPRRLNRYTENIYFHEVKIDEYPLFAYPPYSVVLASKMVEVTTYEELDLLHVHYAVPHATSAYLAKQVLNSLAPVNMAPVNRAPVIITTLHGTDITLVGNQRSYLPITRFSIMQSDGVTTPSHYLKLATYDKLNIPSSLAIEVIPNFVDVNKFTPLDDDKKHQREHVLGLCSRSEYILTHVSNFRPVKRIQDVIKTFVKVNEKIPCHLMLIGDGPERSNIEALVRETGMSKKVCFLGRQESFVEILQHTDVFLLPSESESFGLAALEALSCGVPVIATNVHGIPEVIEHGKVGFLSCVGDTEEMASNVVKLLSNKTLYKTMSAAARQLSVDKFSLESQTTKYENYYYSLLEKS